MPSWPTTISWPSGTSWPAGPAALTVTLDTPTAGLFMTGVSQTVTGTCDLGCAVVVQTDQGTVGSAIVVGSTWSYSLTAVDAQEGVRALSAVASRNGASSTSNSRNALFLGPALRERWKSTDGVSQAGNLVDTWTGVFAGNVMSNTGGATRPDYVAAEATLNNKPTLSGDGIGKYLRCTTFVPATPGTTPSLVLMVAKQNAWTSTRRIFGGGGSSGYLLFQFGTTPAITQFNDNVANNNGAGIIGSWARIGAYFSNSTSDYVRVGASKVIGANAGNHISTGFTLFAAHDLSLPSNVSAADVVHLRRDLTVAEQAAFDAYALSEYGAILA